jgi:hypothetical protein
MLGFPCAGAKAMIVRCDGRILFCRRFATAKILGEERTAALAKLSEGGGPFLWEDVRCVLIDIFLATSMKTIRSRACFTQSHNVKILLLLLKHYC